MIKTLFLEQKNQINLTVGWAVVWLVAFGVGYVVEGAYEIRGREGTTRAGKGGFARLAPKPHEQLHAVVAFFVKLSLP